MGRVACGRAIQTPVDIANIALWLDAGNGIIEAGSGISQWSDLSGQNNHPVQATDANRPQRSTVTGTDGKPVPSIKFSAGTHYLESLTGSGQTDHTMFAVARWTAAPGGALRAICGWGATLGQSSYMGRAISANSIYGDQSANTEGAALVTNTVYLMSKVRQATLDVGQRGRLMMAEDVRSLTAPTNTTGTRLAIGKDSSGNQSMIGDIFAIVMYGRALSFGEIVVVERWLAARYANVLGL